MSVSGAIIPYTNNLEMWDPIKGKCPKCGGDFKETGSICMVD